MTLDAATQQKVDQFVASIRGPLDHFRCFDCSGRSGTSYQVHDALWAQAVPHYMLIRRTIRAAFLARGFLSEQDAKHRPGHVILCLECLELRLQRPLYIDDFTDKPINAELQFGFRLGGDRWR